MEYMLFTYGNIKYEWNTFLSSYICMYDVYRKYTNEIYLCHLIYDYIVSESPTGG